MSGLDVDQVVDILDRLESHPVVVTSELCARQRHRRSTCSRCVDLCPVGAITWEEGLEIDWEACTGCGICAAVCPTGALETKGPSNDELMVRIKQVISDQDGVVFACPRAQGGCKGGAPCLTVSCLGRLDESLLVGAVAYGAASVWLVDGACAGCPQAVGRALAGAALTRSNALLQAFGVPARVAFRHDLPALPVAGGGRNGSAQGVSRRGLFKVLARETARVGEITAETVRDSHREHEPEARPRGDLPRALPSRRLLLLAALKRLGSPAVSTFTGDKEGVFARFSLGDACTACQMCAFFCPTGALTRVVEGGRVGLAFRASHCTNCGLCRDICYRDSVLLWPVVDLDKVLSMSVDWLFAQEMDTEPWKHASGDSVARHVLEAWNRSTQ